MEILATKTDELSSENLALLTAAARAGIKHVFDFTPRPNVLLCSKCQAWKRAEDIAAISAGTTLCRQCSHGAIAYDRLGPEERDTKDARCETSSSP